jgi:hypothetical protein
VPLSFPFHHPRGIGFPTPREGRKVLEPTGLRSSARDAPGVPRLLACINRTLVYSTLTAVLALVYFGSIVVLQRLFVLLTGQQSTLAVVASTLVIAALFSPLHRRIQQFTDKRFYRRKYDTRKTLEDFSAKLRDETDLGALNNDLVSVVRATMQPSHVSLWLRPDHDPEKSGGHREPSG